MRTLPAYTSNDSIRAGLLLPIIGKTEVENANAALRILSFIFAVTVMTRRESIPQR